MQRTVGRHIRKSRSDRVFDVCNVAFMLVFSFLMIYPLYFTVIASILCGAVWICLLTEKGTGGI